MRDTLINNFLRISSIPRSSGNEKQISDFFVEIAKKNNLEYYQDENYNLIIKKKGNIEGDSIAFQVHLDMVCKKRENSNHDFNTDGIDVIINGDEVTAKDTSLGADQGVGLAIMLTLMEEKSIKHPDLEFLFTVEEETTFKGVITFPYDRVESKKMINLDYGIDNAVVVASVGDIVNEYTYEGQLSKKEMKSYKLTLDGLLGGNSGDYIDRSRDNAITLLVSKLIDKEVYLTSINGGTFENDVAVSCEIVLQTNDILFNKLGNSNFKIEQVENDESFSFEDTKNIFNQILDLKSGHITEDSSGNLGLIRTIGNKVMIKYLYRSTKEEDLESFSNSESIFNVNMLYDDHIWKIKDNSFMLKKYKEVYYKLFNEYPIEVIGQGGMEITSFQEAIDGMDIISIGANMTNIHTVDEITYISSWEKIYNIVINMIKD